MCSHIDVNQILGYSENDESEEDEEACDPSIKICKKNTLSSHYEVLLITQEWNMRDCCRTHSFVLLHSLTHEHST